MLTARTIRNNLLFAAAHIPMNVSANKWELAEDRGKVRHAFITRATMIHLEVDGSEIKAKSTGTQITRTLGPLTSWPEWIEHWE